MDVMGRHRRWEHSRRKILLTVAILLPLTSLNCNALPNPMPSPLEGVDRSHPYSDAGSLKQDVGSGKGADGTVNIADLMVPRGDGEVVGLEDGSPLRDADGEAPVGDVLVGDVLVEDVLVGDALTTDAVTEDGSFAPDAALEDGGQAQEDLGEDALGR